MQIYYLNQKSKKYVSEVCGISEDEIEKLNKEQNKEFIYIPDEKCGVTKICNFEKDILIKVDESDNLEELKTKYNLKKDVEVGDVFIVNDRKKYVVKPLDTIEKIMEKFDVSLDYIISKNNLKTDKLFIGQILII